MYRECSSNKVQTGALVFLISFQSPATNLTFIKFHSPESRQIACTVRVGVNAKDFINGKGFN